MTQSLEPWWTEARLGLGLGPDDAARDDLLGRYREPHRRYHDEGHLRACLTILDGLRALAARPSEAITALLFHDAIYVPLAADNEARSAALASEVLARAGAPAEVIARIEAAILATASHAAPADADAALVLDVDLSILAAEEPVFDAYEDAVRAEHSMIDDASFAMGRSAFVASMLERPTLFSTPSLHQRWDAAARANLRRSLMRWRRG